MCAARAAAPRRSCRAARHTTATASSRAPIRRRPRVAAALGPVVCRSWSPRASTLSAAAAARRTAQARARPARAGAAAPPPPRRTAPRRRSTPPSARAAAAPTGSHLPPGAPSRRAAPQSPAGHPRRCPTRRRRPWRRPAPRPPADGRLGGSGGGPRRVADDERVARSGARVGGELGPDLIARRVGQHAPRRLRHARRHLARVVAGGVDEPHLTRRASPPPSAPTVGSSTVSEAAAAPPATRGATKRPLSSSGAPGPSSAALAVRVAPRSIVSWQCGAIGASDASDAGGAVASTISSACPVCSSCASSCASHSPQLRRHAPCMKAAFLPHSPRRAHAAHDTSVSAQSGHTSTESAYGVARGASAASAPLERVDTGAVSSAGRGHRSGRRGAAPRTASV
eukprot:scaffold5163_cov66-Phaeocystis_antarctica.AAC.2